MDEDELQQYRRARLKEWLAANGGAKSVRERRGYSKSLESQISQILHGYPIGNRAARTIESKLGIPAGHLDGPQTSAGFTPQALTIAETFDWITDPKDRTIALAAALDAILAVYQKPGILPSGEHPQDTSARRLPAKSRPPEPTVAPSPAKSRSKKDGPRLHKAR